MRRHPPAVLLPEPNNQQHQRARHHDNRSPLNPGGERSSHVSHHGRCVLATFESARFDLHDFGCSVQRACINQLKFKSWNHLAVCCGTVPKPWPTAIIIIISLYKQQDRRRCRRRCRFGCSASRCASLVRRLLHFIAKHFCCMQTRRAM